NKVLLERNILSENTNTYSFYMFGIGLGTFLALSLFIWMGRGLVTYYQAYAHYSNMIIGIVYLGFSFYLLYLFYKRSFKPIIE
ncbi:MAG: hypothetical protein AAFX53_17170, partial [Bacteroidota bacterium]